MKIIGLIPAAGVGSRLAPLPFSKELFPIGFSQNPENGEKRPKAVSQYLLEHMRAAGAEDVCLILRKGKWDIPSYYGDGSVLGLNLAYLIMNRPYGAPFSLDQAYSFVKDAQIVFGFPDILIEAEDAFTRLLKRQAETGADVVLGLHTVDYPYKWDMVEVQEDGTIVKILPKPKASDLTLAWAFASWGPHFTEFKHSYLLQVLSDSEKITANFELSVGEVVQAAIDSGLRVQSVSFGKNSCLDVGTPEDLQKAILKLT